MMDYLLLILNCEKYREKAIYQKETWLKHIPSNMNYYHIIGNKEKCNTQDIVIDDEQHIIYCNSLDDYNNIPSKIITTLKGVNAMFQYKYIFKTDDDHIPIKDDFFQTLIDSLKHTQPKVHYGGNIITLKDNHFSQYWKIHNCLPKILYLEPTIYATGAFYLLSKEAVECLITKKEHFERKYIEDHAVGYFLDPFYKEHVMSIDTARNFIEID
jgi:hypothetical protein